jgi:hypothetical protein
MSAWGPDCHTSPVTISETFLDTPVRITSFGTLEGTGFFATIPSEAHPGHRWGYVVTAHHVVANKIGLEVQAPVPFGTGRLYDPVEVDVSEWKQPLPNVDLAMAPWRRSSGPVPGLPYELMIPTDVVAGLHLATPVHYVGMFEPLMRPVVRSGSIAALDQCDVLHAHYDHPVHLVDCRSYKGFSGSPCLVEFRFANLEELPSDRLPWAGIPEHMWSGGESMGRLGGISSFVLVCGMFIRHFSDDLTAPDIPSRYGVGVMLPSEYVKEALMTAEARAERRAWDEELTAS